MNEPIHSGFALYNRKATFVNEPIHSGFALALWGWVDINGMGMHVRKYLGVLFGLIIIAAATVLIGPSFVDWNNYKDQITHRVKEMTGRDLVINGDIRIAVLPMPALVVNDISFANLDGASSPQMVRLKSAQVRIALAPLIGGQIEVETVKLIEPVIHLERLSDGTANWAFKAVASNPKDNATTDSAPVTSGTPSVPTIAVDNLSIENATVIYQDRVSGINERVENLNARIAAASLRGPMETAGSAVFRGVPLNFALNVGEIIHGRTVPFNLRAGLTAGDVSAQIGGTLVNLSEVPKFKGSVKLTGKNLAAALSSIAKTSAPDVLAKGFRLEGEVQASASEVQIKPLELALGMTRAAGDMRFEMGDIPGLGTRLEIKTIDLDALMAGNPITAKVSDKETVPPKDLEAKSPATKAVEKTPLRFDLPKVLEASVIVSVDAIAFRGDVIHDAVINAKLSNGLLMINQISAQFPGGSDVAAAVNLHTPNSTPAFSADLDSSVSDLRGALRWLGVALPSVPADRLRKMNIHAQMSGTPEQIQISSLDMQLDSSRLTGSLSVALRDRPSFGANLTLDRLNVDSYLPVSPSKPPAKPSTNAGAAAKPATGPTTTTTGGSNPFAALATLSRFDTNVQAHIKNLVYQAHPIGDVMVDARFNNGGVDIRRFSVGKFAGASTRVHGKVMSLTGVPDVKGLKFETKIPDLARLARAAGMQLPSGAKGLGAISAKGQIDGNLLKPKLKVSANLAGGVMGLDGRVSGVPGGNFIDARVTLKHKDAAGLARRFGARYRPAGRIGGIDFAADVKASARTVMVKNLRAAVGKLNLRGQGDVTFDGPKPVVTATIESGALVIDPFLPAAPKSARRSALPKAKSTAGQRSQSKPPHGNPFSDAPLDLSVLNTVDADITFSAPRLAYDKILIEQASLAATIKDGVLSVPGLSGRVFEGELDAVLEAASGRRNRMAVKGGIDGVNIAQSLSAVTGEALATGRMKIDMDLAASGASVRDLVGGLDGTASLALSNVNANKAGPGSVISGLLGLLTSLNKMGGPNADDRARMTANFKIAQGIAETRDIKIASAYGNGEATGDINLPAWTINVAGEMKLAESFITRLLQAKMSESRTSVPFAISGRLDAPNVHVDTGAFLGAEMPIPGADILFDKAPKDIGNILRGILGGRATPQPKPNPQPDPPAPDSGHQPPPANAPPPKPGQQQAPAINPEQLLKQLFKL